MDYRKGHPNMLESKSEFSGAEAGRKFEDVTPAVSTPAVSNSLRHRALSI